MRVIDLTLPLNAQTPVYTDPDGYPDPVYSAESWATIAEHGYRVHRLQLGTHTGTHLDAPAHFHIGGRTVEKLHPSELVGRVVVIDVRSLARVTATALRPFASLLLADRLPLFVAPETGIPISAGAVAAVATWRPRLILFAGQFLDEAERYHHNRVWLGADIPLVTDLSPDAAAQVRDGDLVIAAPLALDGMDGSPCRVLAIRD
jgi:kynurenine formamidase